MPRGGHNRKSAQQAKLDGTHRDDRHVDPIAIAPGAVLPPPELAGSALGAWERYVAPRANVGFYEPAEAPALALWCVMLIRALEADKLTPTGGIYEVEHELGSTFHKHPAAALTQTYSAEFRALSARLGLDPLSRLALAAGERPARGGPQLPAGSPGAWKPTVVPGGQDPDSYECEACGKVATRRSKRGPKPKRCDDCNPRRRRASAGA